ncbi:EXO70 [Candida oxycetoniae]|uniref:Exocyst complex protein EXO70 n=1 Tax=Candida oxycetoniae TaxID=497107 RepID=A0AAI9SYI6_9ASCO|nr:EXO70 [Candida oxycetoniae]KAI3405128.2 EXO70 [Candida oxycetoniae]
MAYYRVDVDEADVAVLNQNLVKSKELFDSINKSLQKISQKTQTAHSTIKPVLAQVNKLSGSKKEVEKGLALLSEIDESVSRINGFENLLNNSIETIGLLKYMSTLSQARELMNQIKPNFKQFKGIVDNFEAVLARAELKVQNYIDSVLNSDADLLVEKKNDVKVIFEYFIKQGNDQHITSIYVEKRGRQLSARLKAVEVQVKPTQIDAPYEKLQNGINKYTDAVDEAAKQEILVLKQCQLPLKLIGPISEYALSEYNQVLLSIFSQLQVQLDSRNESNLILLEVVDNLLRLEHLLKNRYNVNNASFDKNLDNFIKLGSSLFPHFIRQVDAKFSTLTQFTESSIHQLTADSINIARKMCEFKQPLIKLISTHTAGDWINPEPKLNYIGTFSSLLPNSVQNSSPEFMLSSYFTDIIDCIMINLQIGLDKGAKHAASSGDHHHHHYHSMKKSAQGFLLVRNLYMIETIINRSQDIFNILGTNGQERIAKLKNRFIKIFLEDWSYASYIIIKGMTQIAAQSGQVTSSTSATTATAVATSANNTISSISTATNLSSKEKDQVKDLFRKFNEAFEDALSNYQTFNFGDQNLKHQLAIEVKKLILNAYFKLYDKYGNVDFAKTKSKYVKWDRKEFEKLLNDKL